MTTKEEIPLIADLVKREKYLLGQRLGYDPGDDHPELQTRVAEIILNGFGKWMRDLDNNNITLNNIKNGKSKNQSISR